MIFAGAGRMRCREGRTNRRLSGAPEGGRNLITVVLGRRWSYSKADVTSAAKNGFHVERRRPSRRRRVTPSPRRRSRRRT